MKSREDTDEALAVLDGGAYNAGDVIENISNGGRFETWLVVDLARLRADELSDKTFRIEDVQEPIKGGAMRRIYTEQDLMGLRISDGTRLEDVARVVSLIWKQRQRLDISATEGFLLRCGWQQALIGAASVTVWDMAEIDPSAMIALAFGGRDNLLRQAGDLDGDKREEFIESALIGAFARHDDHGVYVNAQGAAANIVAYLDLDGKRLSGEA